jgi:hypothetical protein
MKSFPYSDEFYLGTFERIGMIKRTGEDSNGKSIYSPTKFAIKFLKDH